MLDQFQEGEDVIIKTQSMLGIINIRKQANRVRKGDEQEVLTKGFDKSLRASAMGTNQPEREGLLGPRRNII